MGSVPGLVVGPDEGTHMPEMQSAAEGQPCLLEQNCVQMYAGPPTLRQTAELHSESCVHS